MVGYKTDNYYYEEKEALDLSSILLMGPHVRPKSFCQLNNDTYLYQKEDHDHCDHNDNHRIVQDKEFPMVDIFVELKASVF